MKKLKQYRPQPQYQRCHCCRMPAVLIKPAALRRNLVSGIVFISLAGLLSGCLHNPSSIIPQDGLTMQAIYTQASQPSVKSIKARVRLTQQAQLIHKLPETAPLIIFAHAVQIGREEIIIPTYTVQFQMN